MSTTAHTAGRASSGRRPITISVDLSLCKACGICVALCSRNVFDRDPLGYPIVARPEQCTGCMLCDWHCPDLAIEVSRGDALAAAAEGDQEAQPGAGAAAALAAEREQDAVTAAVTASHRLSGDRRELPPDAEPGSPVGE